MCSFLCMPCVSRMEEKRSCLVVALNKFMKCSAAAYLQTFGAFACNIIQMEGLLQVLTHTIYSTKSLLLSQLINFTIFFITLINISLYFA